jgi:predicted dehydrogenase
MRRNSRNSNRPNKKVRYAVVGLGYISQIAVLPAFAHARENSELSALISGDPKKLKVLSRKYKVPNTYSYQQFCDCLESGEVDAVYIALPNHLHRAYAEAAAKAGIHVLCEKPMAFSEEECLAMIDDADDTKNAPLSLYSMKLHVLNGKDQFCLLTRRPLNQQARRN